MLTGAGHLSRAILSLPRERIKKLIILEDWQSYHPYLEVRASNPTVVLLHVDWFNIGAGESG